MSVNLAETIALSEFVSTFAGSASERPRDRDDLEALEAVRESQKPGD